MYYNSVLENTDNGYIDYIIKDPSVYYEVGLKVLEYKQRFIGVLSCSKTIQNGSIRLSYNVNAYRTFAEHMMNATYSVWDEMLYKILSIISKINDNGFLKAENLEIDENKIFINLYDNSVKMICIPLYKLTKTEDYDSIRKSLIGIVSRLAVNLSVDDRNQLIKIINRHFGRSEDSDLLALEETQMPVQEEQPDAFGLERPAEPDENSGRRGFFKGLIKKWDEERHPQTVKEPRHAPAPVLYLRAVNAERDIEINKNNFYIGRNELNADEVVPDNPRVSDIHCKLLIDGRRLYIIDYGSEYGTYINDVRIGANILTEFRKGDEITVADMKFRVE